MLDDTPPTELSQAENLDEELVRKSVALDSIYEQAAFEIRLGRLNGGLLWILNSMMVLTKDLSQSLH